MITSQQYRTVTGLFNSSMIKCCKGSKQECYHFDFNWEWIFCTFPATVGTALYYGILCLLIFALMEISFPYLHTMGTYIQTPPRLNCISYKVIDCIIDAISLGFVVLKFKLFKFKRLTGVRLFRCFSFPLLFMNILLIVISNPSLANPGPPNQYLNVNKFSVFHQNVRGFVNFGRALYSTSPVLNNAKILEFQSHIYTHKPDIVCISETWIWDEFRDHEILSQNTYKIFRLDRSEKTHPRDPSDLDKFKEKGGGVLIGVRTDLDVEVKQLKLDCKAEILSIEINCGGNNCVVVTNCYRVGTLGKANHTEIDNHLKSIARKPKYNKHIVVGDFNLSSVTWLNGLGSTTCGLENDFLDLFNEVGFTQLVEDPTHEGGNILDLVLTNCPLSLSNLAVGTVPTAECRGLIQLFNCHQLK